MGYPWFAATSPRAAFAQVELSALSSSRLRFGARARVRTCERVYQAGTASGLLLSRRLDPPFPDRLNERTIVEPVLCPVFHCEFADRIVEGLT